MAGFNDRPFILRFQDDDYGFSTVFWTLLPVLSGIVGAVIFGFIPGALLMLKSRSLAGRIVADSEPSASISIATLFPLGLLLLGVHFGVSGLAGTAGSTIGFLMATDEFSSWSVSTVGSSATYLLSGVLLFAIGRRELIRAA